MSTRLRILAPALFLLLSSTQSAFASWETWICLTNETSVRKLIGVTDVDNYDWDGLSRPDHNWNGSYVEPGQTRCARAQITGGAGDRAFSFIIDGRQHTHKNRMVYTSTTNYKAQWTVNVGLFPERSVLVGHEIVPREYVELGFDCKLIHPNCREFFIKDVP